MTGRLDSLVAPGRELREAGEILSALSAGDEGAEYDSKAAIYDRLIPRPVYNRLLWSTHPSDYSTFAAEAANAAGDGTLLEVACGTAVFTAQPYLDTEALVVLSDRSTGMLERAAVRLRGQSLGERIHLVQADAFDLPFRAGAFDVVASMGALHVFDDIPGFVRSLAGIVRPGGRLYLSALVAETRVGSRYLRLLNRAGEVAEPLSEAEMRARVADGAGVEPDGERRGSMVYLTVDLPG